MLQLWYDFSRVKLKRGDKMKPSIILKEKRELILEIISRYPTVNPRVFGSVAKGTDNDNSDLDILIDALPGTSLFDLGALYEELHAMLGIELDILTPKAISPLYRDQVLAEARPL
jgi:predicted nucleotidyltransferase